MNMQFIRRILKQIAGQTPCPECKHRLDDATFRPTSKEKEKMVFQATCSLCQTEVNFNITSQRITEGLLQQATLPRKQQELSPQKPISQENIKAIGKLIHQFQGTDIRELF